MKGIGRTIDKEGINPDKARLSTNEEVITQQKIAK
jgi:hypothetical protein